MRIRIKNVSSGKFGFGLGAGLLLSPFAKILVGVMFATILGAGGFGVFKMFQVKNLELKLAETSSQLTLTQSELNGCKMTLDEQNRDILNIRIAAEEDVKIIKEVNKQLDKITSVQAREIDRLKSNPAPVTCDESKEWLKENIQLFKGGE